MRRPKLDARQTALALSCVALAVILYWAATMPMPEFPQVADTSGAPGASGPLAVAYALPPEQEFAEISARTVFSSTRRPPAPVPVAQPAKPVPPPPPPPPPATPLSSFTLLGIVTTPEGRTARIRTSAAPAPVAVRERHTLGGWTINQILDDRVLLEANGNRAELSFPTRPKPAGSSGAGAVSPPPLVSPQSR